jgi:hypothetical protein
MFPSLAIVSPKRTSGQQPSCAASISRIPRRGRLASSSQIDQPTFIRPSCPREHLHVVFKVTCHSRWGKHLAQITFKYLSIPSHVNQCLQHINCLCHWQQEEDDSYRGSFPFIAYNRNATYSAAVKKAQVPCQNVNIDTRVPPQNVKIEPGQYLTTGIMYCTRHHVILITLFISIETRRSARQFSTTWNKSKNHHRAQQPELHPHQVPFKSRNEPLRPHISLT